VKARFIYEKFIEDSDPIHDMGIGIKHKIEEWIGKNRGNFKVYFKGCTGTFLKDKDIIINDDLTIDINGWTDMSGGINYTLPEYIKFNRIKGDFACRYDITQFEKFMPKYVEGQVRFYIDVRPWPNISELEHKIRSVCKIKGDVSFRYG
jgi:hypothetical protein